ncbi:MAG: TetR family transcriptional regulator [Rhodospirillales bacterium]|nr:TetR family transcriptional regulator [Rhodospirillales bacterium]
MSDWKIGAFDREAQHELKRRVLLDEASVLFNQQGFTGTTLDEVAKRLNLTKAALYYYVKNKEDLAVQSYNRTCELQADYLKRADESGKTGLEKIHHYIENSTQSDNPPSAILMEVAALKEGNRKPLQKAVRANAVVLRGFIAQGIKDGTITECDPTMVSLAIIGSLSWMHKWVDVKQEAIEEVGKGLVDLFINGMAPQGATVTSSPNVDASFTAKAHTEIFDRTEQARLKREALLKAATNSFNQKGFTGTSLNDVVKTLNVSKGAFYYYVKNKDDLLFQCLQRSLELIGKTLNHSENEGTTGREKLESLLRNGIATHCGPEGPIAVFTDLMALEQDRRDEIITEAVKYLAILQEFMDTGLSDGSIRECSRRTTLFGVVGAMSWLPKWYTAGGTLPPHQIAAQFCKLFTYGLKPR